MIERFSRFWRDFMNVQISPHIRQFFDKNLFERIIIYLFLAELIVKIVFELALGQWYFEQSQHKQLIFYALLGMDYMFSFKKIMNIRVTVNVMSLFSLFLFILIGHGLVVGILSNNRPFELVNDTIPLLMIALNVLRFQSYEEMKNPIDFRFLLQFCTIVATAFCLIGFLAVKIGRPSVANVPVGPIFYPLFFAGLIMVRPFPKILLPLFAVTFVLSLPEINRTSIAFIGLVLGGYSAVEIIKNPSKGILLLGGLAVLVSVSWMLLPEDSKTYRRIVGLTEIDFSKRTGSVGERSAENDAIKRMLASKGQTSELVGAGFGGLYEVQFTHAYHKNYGHAHYAWAWFNLRFGQIGYFYFCVLLGVLMFNVLNGFRVRHSLGLFTALLCLFGLLYCLTYVNAVFLSSGLHFLHLRTKGEEDLNA